MDISVPIVKTLYDLLKELITHSEKREREVFEKILTPIYNELVVVHSDYNKMFLNAHHTLSEILDKENGNPEKRRELIAEINSAKAKFREARHQYEYMRMSLSMSATAILKSLKGKDSRRFIFMVIMYFQYNQRTIVLDEHDYELEDFNTDEGLFTNETLDKRISEIISRGIERTSGSSIIEKAITLEENPKVLQPIIKKALDKINRRYANITTQYRLLQLKIYN